MIWREQRDHTTDCYFCMTSVKGFNGKNKKSITYPNLPSAIRPIAHSDDIPVPTPPVSLPDSDSTSSDGDSNEDNLYYQPENSQIRYIMLQVEPNDLVRDLRLTKGQSELLASRLQEWNWLEDETKVTFHCKRTADLTPYFSMKGDLCYCNNIYGLFSAFNIDYDVSEWRLFIDASKYSIKAVLLHNGNIYPSVPIAHSVTLKETYENLRFILDSIQYDDHKWSICADLKVVAILTGLQSGYTKYCCFLCLWDSRDRKEHYSRKEWPVRNTHIPGTSNIKNPALIDKSDVLLPPLHIKLGLMKQMVKAMDKILPAFNYLVEKFQISVEQK